MSLLFVNIGNDQSMAVSVQGKEILWEMHDGVYTCSGSNLEVLELECRLTGEEGEQVGRKSEFKVGDVALYMGYSFVIGLNEDGTTVKGDDSIDHNEVLSSLLEEEPGPKIGETDLDESDADYNAVLRALVLINHFRNELSMAQRNKSIQQWAAVAVAAKRSESAVISTLRDELVQRTRISSLASKSLTISLMSPNPSC